MNLENLLYKVIVTFIASLYDTRTGFSINGVKTNEDVREDYLCELKAREFLVSLVTWITVFAEQIPDYGYLYIQVHVFNLLGLGSNSGRLYTHTDTAYYRSHFGWW